jgi:hypothetical protein
MRYVQQATTALQLAVMCDRSGNISEALQQYRLAVANYTLSINLAPDNPTNVALAGSKAACERRIMALGSAPR